MVCVLCGGTPPTPFLLAAGRAWGQSPLLVKKKQQQITKTLIKALFPSEGKGQGYDDVYFSLVSIFLGF